MSRVHILYATRGRWGKPVPVLESTIRWIGEDEQPTKPPKKARCQHPNHWQWGNGTRNGQKLIYPLEELFFQKWEMTKKELRDAIKQFDMASLDISSRVICKNCAVHQTPELLNSK